MSIIPNQEAVMGNAIPAQHPAVVLRWHLQIVRAALAAAMIAVVGLSIAVVMVATDTQLVSSTRSASAVYPPHYGSFNPEVWQQESAPLAQEEHAVQSSIGSTRYDGGPEEGTRGNVQAPAPNSVDESQNGPGARTD
jgi:hypothetical protein